MTYVVIHPFDQDNEIEFVTRNKERAIAFARSLCRDSNRPTAVGGQLCGSIELFFPDPPAGEAAD